MGCNGISNLFVIVLEFSVMVLSFFSAVLLHFFIQCVLSHFKGCCWLRSVFMTTKKMYIYCLNTSLILNVAYLKVTYLVFIFFSLGAGLLMSFQGNSCQSIMIICVQLQT